MAILRFAFLATILAPCLALAQPAPPPPLPSREAIRSFVDAFATPTHMTGKVARWEEPICPAMIGQAPNVSAFVTEHVAAVAAAVGAPVNSNKGCAPNIEIVFTTAPQTLLDNVRQNQADYIGYASSNSVLKTLATVTHPIQAWYATGVRDLRGRYTIDSGRDRGVSSGVNSGGVTGTHLADGQRSAIHHVLIVVDPAKLPGQDIVPLSDYIAMLALAQIGSPDDCRPLPSIANMLAPACESKTTSMTANDLGYLHGLYGMDADRLQLVTQKNDIVDRMAQALGAR
jgi:hypothetical protein